MSCTAYRKFIFIEVFRDHDQVESLTAARSAAMGGNEPSDAVRVVNAVLTQVLPVYCI